MTDRTPTRDRILDASRRLFNEKGYAATTLAEIAASIDIAQGNLTYHFPTKLQLVEELQEQSKQTVLAHRARYERGAVTDDYVDMLVFAMKHGAENRFLLRDRAQFTKERGALEPDRELEADVDSLHQLLRRAKKEGLFRRDLDFDLDILSRSLWIVSRYWMEYLRELEGTTELSWKDLERGLHHHFAVLLPHLTATARRDLESSVSRVSEAMRDGGREAETMEALERSA